MLPFTPEQFFSVFTDYNNAIWPIQIVGEICWAVLQLHFCSGKREKQICSSPAVWPRCGCGPGSAITQFRSPRLTTQRFFFAALFIVQGFYFIYAGVYHHQLRFGVR